jgi:hypothetical protein
MTTIAASAQSDSTVAHPQLLAGLAALLVGLLTAIWLR